MNSSHKCEVVRLDVAREIPGADRILVVDVFGGYPCVVQKREWVPGSLWVYIPPDSVVNLKDARFSWLEKARIKTRRYKKQISMGLLMPLKALELNPGSFRVGDDLAAKLGITHYEPPVKGNAFTPKTTGLFRRLHRFSIRPPPFEIPYYDIEPLRRWSKMCEGLQVVVTEKIHGSNVAYCYQGGFFRWLFGASFRIRSRNVWRSWWGRGGMGIYGVAATRGVKALVKEYPHLCLFGEVYGPQVQAGFDYGVKTPRFIAFDIWDHQGKKYWGHQGSESLCARYDIPWVPILYEGVFDFDKILELAEGRSALGGQHVREGVVVRCAYPRDGIFRQLKCVGNGYYEQLEQLEQIENLEVK